MTPFSTLTAIPHHRLPFPSLIMNVTPAPQEMITGVRPNTTHDKGELVPLDKERYQVLMQDKKVGRGCRSHTRRGVQHRMHCNWLWLFLLMRRTG